MGLVRRVVVEEPFHGGGVQAVAVLVAAIGLGAGHGIGHGVGQELQAQLGAAMVAGPDRGGGRQVAAGAVAADRQAARVDADRRAVGRDPLQGGHDVVERARKACLGGQAIVDGEDRDAGFDGELGAQRVVAVEVAEHPAATMGVDQAGKLVVPRRREGPVEPHRQVAARPGDGAIDHRRCARPRPLGTGAQGQIEVARGLRRERVPGRPVGRGHDVDQALRFGIEGHSSSSIFFRRDTLAAPV